MRRIVLFLSFMLGLTVCGQENPFSGIFGEECFRNAAEYKQSVVAQYENLLCEDSPKSNPATIRAFVDFFYRGKPIPDTQAADAAGDHWDALVKLLCLEDQEAPLKELLASGKGTALFRIQARALLITLYWEGSKQRKALEQEQLKAIEAAVLEGRWKGRIGYQWYYNYLTAYSSVGRRYWGELETLLRPKAAEIDPWFWEMVQGRAGIFWAWLGHELQAFGPALDDLVQAEYGGFAALVGAVEDLAVREGALVLALDLAAGLRLLAGALFQDFVQQAAAGAPDLRVAGGLGEELLAFLLRGLAGDGGPFGGFLFHLLVELLEGFTGLLHRDGGFLSLEHGLQTGHEIVEIEPVHSTLEQVTGQAHAECITFLVHGSQSDCVQRYEKNPHKVE